MYIFKGDKNMGTRAMFFSYIGPTVDPVKISKIRPDYYRWLGRVQYDGYPSNFKGIWDNCEDEKRFFSGVRGYFREDGEWLDEENDIFPPFKWCELTGTMVDYVYVWFPKYGVYVSRFGSKFFKFYHDVMESEKFLPADKLRIGVTNESL